MGFVKHDPSLDGAQPGPALSAIPAAAEPEDGSKVSSSTTLDAQHRCLRWKNTVASVCMFGVLSGIFGMSPLTDLMNKQAPERLQWLAPGVTVPAVTHLLSQAVVLPLTGGVAKKLKPLHSWLLVTLGMASPLSIGLSTLDGFFWLQYVGAAVASVGVATSLEYTQVIVLQWWSIDGRQNIGVACQGTMMASSMVLISVMLGCTGNDWGLAGAAYFEVGLLLLLNLFPLLLALRGELGSPPADLLPRRAALTGPGLQAPGAGLGLARSACFWHVVVHHFLVPFTGFGMKLLLTSVFQAAYSASFLHSALLASASMVLFVLARGLFPLLGQAMPLFLMVGIMLLVNSTLYASYPAIIAHLPVWWLVAGKSLAGATFAAILCLNPLVLLEIYSPADLPVVFAASGPARGLGFAMGPVTGYYLFLACQSGGMDADSSYNLFFYICAALSFVGAINMWWLHGAKAHR